MNLLKYLKKYPDNYSEFIINIFLVFKGARDACLLESANCDDCDMNEMIKLSVLNGLVAVLENEEYKRWLIAKPKIIQKYLSDEYKDDITLATLLNFKCVGHDYANDTIERIYYHIDVVCSNNGNYYLNLAEVCELSKIKKHELKKFVIKKVKKLKKVLPKCFVVEYKIKSTF